MKPYYPAVTALLGAALLLGSMAGGVSAWPVDQRAAPYANQTPQPSSTRGAPSTLPHQKKCPPTHHASLHLKWWSS